MNIVAETAYDEEEYAHLVKTRFEKENYRLKTTLRHIHKDFSTLTGRPTGRGVTGGIIHYDRDFDSGADLSVYLDLYRNHHIPNPSNPDGLNYDIGSNVSMPLSDSVHWSASAYYSDTPQLISPRENININTTLHKRFKVFEDWALSTFIGVSHQRSRFKRSSGNNYDRSTLRAGLRFPLLKYFSYFINYDFNYIDPKDREGVNKPHVISTGLSYSQTFWDKVTTRASISYRDEEDTEGEFSFLSGTDILRTNLGISYRPTPDYEIFVDGGFRNVWAENNEQVAFNDADVRFGLRASWDLLFGWNPKGTISGMVFKDFNRNGTRETNEPGIGDIKIRVGNVLVTTNDRGFYSHKVRAKSVKVAVALDSIPSGHSLTGDVSQTFSIEQGQRYTMDFGFSIQTEVYGVFFVDANNNGTFDVGEKTVPRVRMTMDGNQTSVSDFEGIYTFYDVTPGEHTLKIDVNSLPIQYLPRVKLIKKVTLHEGGSVSFNVPLVEK